MSDIERVPSMRKAARQGVPKRKPRDLATPAQSGKMKDAPQIAPKAAPAPVDKSTLPDELMVPQEPMLPSEPMLPPEPTLALEPEPTLEPEPALSMEVEPEPAPEPETRPAPTPQSLPEPAPAAAADASALTMREMFARVDAAWAAFRAAAFRFPAEHMNDHLTDDGWTRKQMLAHIAAWHDLTSDRLVKLALTGRPAPPLERDEDAINAAAARVAIGKTAGEVLKDVEATFNRLRRQMQRLSDAHLRLGDAWAARVIAGNTYEHYAEHIAELTPPEPPPGSGARR